MFVQAAESSRRQEAAGDTKVVYKRGGPASRIYACTSSYISIVQLLFHGEPLKLANGLDIRSIQISTFLGNSAFSFSFQGSYVCT